MASSMTAAHSAQASLHHGLAHIASLHAQRRDNPILAGALERLSRWQSRRLRMTYSDLAAQPRYARAIRFFEQDLYGASDFAARDADLARVAPLMVYMLPERVVATVADAVELHGLSQDLDRALLARLPRADGLFGVAEYCRAFRRMNNREGRERQIEFVARIGTALDSYVRKPLLYATLTMMRRPAEMAGLGALHSFLERGFVAFREMGGATEFIATIVGRETDLVNAIFEGDTAPFDDPLNLSRRAAE